LKDEKRTITRTEEDGNGRLVLVLPLKLRGEVTAARVNSLEETKRVTDQRAERSRNPP